MNLHCLFVWEHTISRMGAVKCIWRILCFAALFFDEILCYCFFFLKELVYYFSVHAISIASTFRSIFHTISRFYHAVFVKKIILSVVVCWESKFWLTICTLSLSLNENAFYVLLRKCICSSSQTNSTSILIAVMLILWEECECSYHFSVLSTVQSYLLYLN